MLFGSEGSVKTFTSDSEEAIVSLADQPKAVDPIALHASLAVRPRRRAATTSLSPPSYSTRWARI
jgi:hypothetical protein